MSFIKARGEAAAQQAAKEKQTYEKLLKTFKSGDSYKVRIAGPADFAMYTSHGVYVKGGQGIFTTPCVHGDDCPYCAAVKEYWDDWNTSEIQESKDIATQLSSKERYLFGFVNLDDNTPLILDFSKKQAKGLISMIKKNEKKLDKFAFEIAKEGTGQATQIVLSIIVDPDEDLNDTQRANFDASAEFVFEDEMFEVLPVKSITEGIEDLRKFGFDISRISGAAPSTPSTPVTENNQGTLADLF